MKIHNSFIEQDKPGWSRCEGHQKADGRRIRWKGSRRHMRCWDLSYISDSRSDADFTGDREPVARNDSNPLAFIYVDQSWIAGRSMGRSCFTGGRHRAMWFPPRAPRTPPPPLSLSLSLSPQHFIFPLSSTLIVEVFGTKRARHRRLILCTAWLDAKFFETSCG